MTPAALASTAVEPRGGVSWSVGLAVAFAALAIVVNQSAAHWRDNLADDHLFAFFGWRVAHGATPYVDVWDNKPPGIWWVNAATFLIGGEGPWGPILASSAALSLTLTAFAGAAAALVHPSIRALAIVVGALVLTNLRYECGGNRTETWVVALETLTVCGYLWWRRSGRGMWLVVAALAAGATPLFKQAGVAAAAACAMHAVCSSWRRWWRATRGRRTSGRADSPPRWARGAPPAAALTTTMVRAGAAALAPAMVAIVVLAAQGALYEAYVAVAAFNRAYFAVNDARWLPNEMVWRVVKPALAPLLPLLILAAAGGVVATSAFLRRRRDRWNSGARAATGVAGAPAPRSASTVVLSNSPPAGVPGAAALLGGWVLLACYLALVGPGRREYHLMPMLPGLALLALGPLQALGGPRGLRLQLASHPTHCAVLVAYALVLLSYAAPGAAATLAAWRQKSAPWSTRWAESPPHELQAAYLRAHSSPTDRVYVWGWSPGTYRAAYRPNASRFATLEKCSHVGEHASFILDGAIADLRARPPRWMLMTPSDLAGLRTSSERDFGDWLARRYLEREVVGGMIVLERVVD